MKIMSFYKMSKFWTPKKKNNFQVKNIKKLEFLNKKKRKFLIIKIFRMDNSLIFIQ